MLTLNEVFLICWSDAQQWSLELWRKYTQRNQQRSSQFGRVFSAPLNVDIPQEEQGVVCGFILFYDYCLLFCVLLFEQWPSAIFLWVQ